MSSPTSDRPAPPAARPLEALLVVPALGLIALVAAHPLGSPDTFWHLKLGEIIAATRAIPERDLFSAVHPDRPWVQFAWLWELLAFAVTRAHDLLGLRLAQGLLMAASFGLLYARLRFGWRLGLAATAWLVASGFLLFADRFQARPDALSLGLGVLAAPLVLGGFRKPGPRVLLATFGMALLWVNLHAGTSLLLIGSLAVCAAGAALNGVLRCGPSAAEGRPDAWTRALAMFALAALALLISPGALRGVLHFAGVFGAIVDAREPEWSASLVMLRYGHHPALVLIATAPYLAGAAYVFAQLRRVRAQGRAGVDVAELLLCAAFLVLAAAVVRNVFLCLLPLACLLRGAPAPGRGVQRALAAGAVLLFGTTVDYTTRDAFGSFDRVGVAYGQDLVPDAYPEHAAEFLRAAGIEGQIINFPRWGDYLIWQLFPRGRVLLDTRRNLTPELWRLATSATDPLRRSRMLDLAFARYGLDLVVYDGPVFASYRPEGDWRLLYKAGPEEVYLHARSPRAAESLARARRYYAARGFAPGADPQSGAWIETVTRAGGVDYLAQPYRAFLRTGYERAAAGSDPEARARARRSLGLLYFRAGAYSAALPLLSAALARDPNDASARYHLAFAWVLTGERAAGLQVARAFPPDAVRRLNPAQVYRLQQLLRDERGAHASRAASAP